MLNINCCMSGIKFSYNILFFLSKSENLITKSMQKSKEWYWGMGARTLVPSQHLHKQLTWGHASVVSMLRRWTVWSGLAGQLAWGAQGSSYEPYIKINKVDDIWGVTSKVDLLPLHVCTHTNTHKDDVSKLGDLQLVKQIMNGTYLF